MILGIDISTSCTGFCVLNEDGVVIDFSYVDLKKVENFFDKVKKVKFHIMHLTVKYSIDEIIVEEFLQAFRTGFSSASTLFKLAKFNGIIQWICYDHFNIETNSLNVNSARKLAGIKIIRKSEVSTKDQVLEQVIAEVGENHTWPRKILKSGPRKGQEIVDKNSYDMADAYVIAKARWIEKSKKIN